MNSRGLGIPFSLSVEYGIKSQSILNNFDNNLKIERIKLNEKDVLVWALVGNDDEPTENEYINQIYSILNAFGVDSMITHHAISFEEFLIKDKHPIVMIKVGNNNSPANYDDILEIKNSLETFMKEFFPDAENNFFITHHAITHEYMTINDESRLIIRVGNDLLPATGEDCIQIEEAMKRFYKEHNIEFDPEELLIVSENITQTEIELSIHNNTQRL